MSSKSASLEASKNVNATARHTDYFLEWHCLFKAVAAVYLCVKQILKTQVNTVIDT